MGWVEVRTHTAHVDTCVVIRLSPPLSGEELAALCRRVDTLIRLGCGGGSGGASGGACGKRTGLICDVTALDTVDLGILDQLAQVRLAARRAGGTVTFQHAGTALKALLAFVGLDDVLLADADDGAASVKRERQTEQLEEPGVQEDVEVRHPPV